MSDVQNIFAIIAASRAHHGLPPLPFPLPGTAPAPASGPATGDCAYSDCPYCGGEPQRWDGETGRMVSGGECGHCGRGES